MHRWPTYLLGRLPPALLLLALAGCTTTGGTGTPPPAGGAATGAAYGTIVAMRPPSPAEAPRRRVLAALGAADASPDGAVEFIVRADDGQPISVMQDAADGLRPGDRVALISGPHTRITLTRAARAAP